MSTHRPWLIAICVAAAIGAVAAPAEAADAKAGQKLAATWCASCHVIGRDGQGAATDAAPTFVLIANRPITSEERLQAFLADPHKAAMKGVVLPRFEIADLAAYIVSLKEAGQ
ncbi:MAG: cytochrome c [Alphaproteobacteria bacterium]|nr:cytochrome c [Alphaproteobacteria bacterium]